MQRRAAVKSIDVETSRNGLADAHVARRRLASARKRLARVSIMARATDDQVGVYEQRCESARARLASKVAVEVDQFALPLA